MNEIVLNIGLNDSYGEVVVNAFESTASEFRKAFGHLPYLLTTQQGEATNWDAEEVLLAKVQVGEMSRKLLNNILEYMCFKLNQDAIAYTYNGVGFIAFNPNYEGRQYHFDKKFFKNL